MYNNIIVLNHLIFIFFRVLSIIYTAPIVGSSVVSRKLKFFLSCLLSILIFFIIPCAKIKLLSCHGLVTLIEQIIIGMSIGFSIKLIVFFIIVSGEIVSLQIGLYNIINTDDTVYLESTIITQIFNIFLLLLCLYYDGHLYIIIFIVKSFYLFPLYSTVFDMKFVLIFIKLLHASFLNGLIFVLPIIILFFLFYILIGVFFRLSTNISTVFVNLSLLYFIIIFFLFFSSSIFFYNLTFILKKIIHLLYILFL
ncbi:flagellar biosynthetic protein FliR [Buchnera aphidicola (Takecallis taiwana)]|uniref:flagellar biosynthetic protein FliR n=1 Tax=Buchnera aphidicola TaxID=9 RepID=UPI0031B6B8E0